MRRRTTVTALVGTTIALLLGAGWCDDQKADDIYTFSVESIGNVDPTALVTSNQGSDSRGKAKPLAGTPLPWQASLRLPKGQKDWWALVLIATGNRGPVKCTISQGTRVLDSKTGMTALCEHRLF